MIDLAMRANGALPRIAAVMDVRSRAFSTDLQSSIRELGSRGIRPRVVFLEASDETLVRRFENVRRPHPLQEDGRVVDGIAAERELLSGIREEADLVLDTSALNVHELRARMRDFFGTPAASALRVSIVSFGYKYGLPVDADLVADCRFLPNPRWVDSLAPLNGQDERVREYVLKQPGAEEFLEVLHRGAADHLRRVRPAGEAVRDAGGGLYRRQAPQRDHGRADRHPAGGGRPGNPGGAPRSGA